MVRYSRLVMTCGKGWWSPGCPQVKRPVTTQLWADCHDLCWLSASTIWRNEFLQFGEQRAGRSLDRAGGNPPSRRGRPYPARRPAQGVLFTLGVLVLVIWLISESHASLSFLWVVAALAVLMIAQRVTGGRARSKRRSARPRRNYRRRDDGQAGQ
jgi:hypothetical protein